MVSTEGQRELSSVRVVVVGITIEATSVGLVAVGIVLLLPPILLPPPPLRGTRKRKGGVVVVVVIVVW